MTRLGVAGPVMILGWVVAIFVLGGYRLQVFGAGIDEYKRTVNASLATAAAGRHRLLPAPASTSPAASSCSPSLIGIPMLVLGRLVLRRSVQRARRRGLLQHRVVIAGTEGHVDEIAASSAARSGSATTWSAPSPPRCWTVR